MLTLNAEKRNMKRKASALRKEGLFPAVCYGPKDQGLSLAIKAVDFEKVWKTAGESTMVELATPDGIFETLIYDVQVDPVTNKAIHADFYIPERGKKVTVPVPLEFIGVAPAVKDLSGLLVKVLHEIEVEVLPKDLPNAITVDISSLTALDSHIAVKDLKLPPGVVALAEPDGIVAAISVVQEEPEEAPIADLSSIEVEKKGKKEEESTEVGAETDESKEAKKEEKKEKK